MTDEPSTGPQPGTPHGAGSGQTGPAAAPETYVWPLVALGVVILPQVLVPAKMREGPPLVVPAIEATVVLILLAVAAKPGPVPRAARPLVLSLFAVLILANTAAAVRLVALVLRSTPEGEAPPTVTQLLVTAVTLLATNIVTFGLLYWQIDGGGPDVRAGGCRALSRLPVPQTGSPGSGATRLAATIPGPPLPGVHQRRRVQPTDTLPLTHRVKGLMAIQSMISLGVLVVVLSRVINILPP